jgi:hypothetical protein
MINGLDLLVVALNQLHGHCGQVSEQSSGTRIRSGGEVYFDSRRCGGIVIARASIPDANFPNPLMAIGFPVAACNSSSNLPVARLWAAVEPLDSVVPPPANCPNQQVMTKAT